MNKEEPSRGSRALAARASLYLYTTVEEVERLADALSEIPRRESR
jgi:selenocysteine lyase/cysteine desulfurase